MKLKCWKKIMDKPPIWRKKNGEDIMITKNNKGKILIREYKGFQQPKMVSGSYGLSKSEAIKFAKSYMKKHDKC